MKSNEYDMRNEGELAGIHAKIDTVIHRVEPGENIASTLIFTRRYKILLFRYLLGGKLWNNDMKICKHKVMRAGEQVRKTKRFVLK